MGKKRLEKAIALYQKVIPGGSADVFNVTWLPYYLDSTLPKVGVDRTAHLEKKYGAERVGMIQSRLTVMGKSEGIEFSLHGKVGNTRDAHRLIQLGKTRSNEVQNRIVTELFKSHFEEDGDVTSHSMLTEAAVKAGLDRDEVKEWLEKGRGGNDVDIEAQRALENGVRGVPSFTINGKYQVDGAQDVEYFMNTFMEARGPVADTISNPTQGVSC